MSDTATNHSFRQDPMELEGKARILVELWKERKDSKFFADLISYGDKLDVYQTALAIEFGLEDSNEKLESVIDEVWTLLLTQLKLSHLDIEFVDLDDLLYEASSNGVVYD